jgi:hypothetical protein
MLKLITLKNYKDSPPEEIENIIDNFRDTFAAVFSAHYAKLLAPPLKNAVEAGEVKDAKELKSSSDPVLKGFSDLLPKKHFFEKSIERYDEAGLKTAFKKIYRGPGFDDEAAFLLAFHDMDLAESKNARDHYDTIKARLKPDDRAEVESYLDCLDKRECELKEVNFVALVDENKVVRGFALFHVLQEKDMKTEKDIKTLHIRQAAMREQSRGYAGLMSRYFADHYPEAIYEANQRKANTVLMKKNLVEEKLLKTTDAVLGYNQEYYLGLRGTSPILNSFLEHNERTPKKLFSKFGEYYEAESVNNFFKPATLHRESFALQDDNFAQEQIYYLRKAEFKK